MRSLITAAMVFGLAASASAAPTPAAPGKSADPMAAARKGLDEVADMTYQGRSLNDVVNDLKVKAKMNLIIDPSLPQFGLDPNMPIVNVAQKDVKVRDGLRAVLAPYNLRFGLIREGLYISTDDGVTAKQLRQRVTVDCDGTPFATAAKQLASDTGANVVIDPRLKDKANSGVSLKLDDVPLETAVRLLAEVADLRAVRMNNVLFVTTPERAEKLRADADGPVPAGGANPVFPGNIAPGFGGGVAVPFQVFPAPAAPAVDLPAKPVEAPAKPENPPEKK